jgi:hypothetical protein
MIVIIGGENRGILTVYVTILLYSSRGCSAEKRYITSRRSSKVEHRFCKAAVGGSIPLVGSLFKANPFLPVTFVLSFYSMTIGTEYITFRNLCF